MQGTPPIQRESPIERATTVIVGAGHAGLAASRLLTERSIDHIVLERGEVANSWRRERWDSFRLLTPNWQSGLPGFRYDGPEPDGYMTSAELVERIAGFAAHARAPVRTGTVPGITQLSQSSTSRPRDSAKSLSSSICSDASGDRASIFGASTSIGSGSR